MTIDVSKLKEWFGRTRRSPDDETPDQGGDSLEVILGRHGQANDFLRDSLEMLIAARRAEAEAEAEAENRKTETNGAINGCQ